MVRSRKEREQLESLMDLMGVADLFASLAQIAEEKADHVASNWQDSHLAKRWERLATKFDKLSGSVDDPYFP